MTDLKKQNNKKFPHVFIILFFILLSANILTYVLDAGEYTRVIDETTGQSIVVANSYTQLPNSPVSFIKIPSYFFAALTSEKTSKLIFFILIIGGSFEIILQTGSIQGIFGYLLRFLKDKRKLCIPIFISLFSIFGFTMGLTTASIMFVPIGILTAQILGFDKLTGIAMVALGTNAGFAAGIFNPFSVGIAQSIAELPLYSGAWIRWLLLIFLLIATNWYIMRYAKKHDTLKDGEKSIQSEVLNDLESLNKKHIFVLALLIFTFGYIIFGIIRWEWSIPDMAVLFLVLGVMCGIVNGNNANDICITFVTGAKKMVTGVFVIGLAATIRLILSDAQILDTLTYYLVETMKFMPKPIALFGMYMGNAFLDLLVTSGSAHAALIMPIMIPMSDALEISRQSAVFAFQLGDGLVNLVSPLSTTLTAIIAVADISYAKWLKFFAPLVGIYLLIGTVFIIFAGAIGY